MKKQVKYISDNGLGYDTAEEAIARDHIHRNLQHTDRLEDQTAVERYLMVLSTNPVAQADMCSFLRHFEPELEDKSDDNEKGVKQEAEVRSSTGERMGNDVMQTATLEFNYIEDGLSQQGRATYLPHGGIHLEFSKGRSMLIADHVLKPARWLNDRDEYKYHT